MKRSLFSCRTFLAACALLFASAFAWASPLQVDSVTRFSVQPYAVAAVDFVKHEAKQIAAERAAEHKYALANVAAGLEPGASCRPHSEYAAGKAVCAGSFADVRKTQYVQFYTRSFTFA